MVKEKKKGSEEMTGRPAPKSQDISNVSESISVNIAGQIITGKFGDFSTGSKGWKAFGKVVIEGVRCQVSCNIIIIGSKPGEKK